MRYANQRVNEIERTVAPRTRRRVFDIRGISLLGVTTIALAGLSTAASAPPDEIEVQERIYWDEADETGQLSGGFIDMVVRLPRSIEAIPALGDETIFLAGDPANRVDVVFVGDGFTVDELDDYAIEVDGLAAAFLNEEPFTRYADYFNIHRVDVVSNESGVDNDPVPGIDRDTAMNMKFWCNDIERLLCIDVAKAYQYAANAPDWDLIAAIANSQKYGGGGYIENNLGTASLHVQGPEVLLHEFGHALGNLADEYNYGGGQVYNGPEVPEPNASILTESEMLAQQRKWWRWIGTNDPAFDGLVSTFEGCRYYVEGIYRPTNNSLMNSLYRPFNLPSVENTIFEIYKIVRPIDASSDPNLTYDGTETLFVDPMEPAGAPLSIKWYLDGLLVPHHTGSGTLDLAALNLAPGYHKVTLIVRDETEWVRDEIQRDLLLTQTLEFDIEVPGEPTCLDLDVSNLVAGQGALFEVYDGQPGQRAVILWGVQDGDFNTQSNGWCVAFEFDVPGNQIAARTVASRTLDSSGSMFAIRSIPANRRGTAVRFQAAQRGTCPDTCMSEVIAAEIE